MGHPGPHVAGPEPGQRRRPAGLATVVRLQEAEKSRDIRAVGPDRGPGPSAEAPSAP